MSNKSFRGFPRRRDETYTRRAFNMDYAPRYADLACWYDLSRDVYSDDAGVIPANPGDAVALVKDQSQYGRHMRQTNTAYRPAYTVDSGFFALLTGLTFMKTSEAFATASSFAVFRSPYSVWAGYGCIFGREPDVRPYLFANTGTSFNDVPQSYTRKNGISLANGAALAPIDTLMLLALDHRNAGTIAANILGGHYLSGVATNFRAALVIVELLAYTSVLPQSDIEDIEAMLLAKYQIS